MASPRRSKSIEDLYTRILRVKRKQILIELPDTKELLKDPRLEKIFTRSEKIEMVSQRTQSDNAEKMIRALEFKGYDSYKIFIAVLEDYRPSLAHKLSTAAEEIQRMHSAGSNVNDLRVRPSSNNSSSNSITDSRVYSGNDDEDYEDAGIFDFNERGSGPSYHISCISISCRNFLSDHLNQRETFTDFCQAMQIDGHMTQVCLRSLNPTGYLLQELLNDPNMTMAQLKTALKQIGKPQLYESVLQLNDTL